MSHISINIHADSSPRWLGEDAFVLRAVSIPLPAPGDVVATFRVAPGPHLVIAKLGLSIIGGGAGLPITEQSGMFKITLGSSDPAYDSATVALGPNTPAHTTVPLLLGTNSDSPLDLELKVGVALNGDIRARLTDIVVSAIPVPSLRTGAL